MNQFQLNLNVNPLEDLHKLDKEQLIKEYAEFRQYNFDKLTLIEQIADILAQELGR